MAKPPAGSSLLFGALADFARIKQRKNGSYRMVLRGIDHIDWFTDRPDRIAGEWSPKKLVKKWESLFGDVEPNAQATFEMGKKRELVTFEMFKPKLEDSNQKLSFKIRGIGKKNKDLLTGLRNEQLSDASLFIDDAMSGPNTSCLPNCDGANLTNVNLSYADLENANLAGADLSNADLIGAKLDDADLSSADLTSAKLEYSDLIGTNLSKANLKNANLLYASMHDALLEGANLTDAKLPYAILEGANLNGANLSGALLTDANLTDADLSDANLKSAWLDDANLSGAKLKEANLEYANLRGAKSEPPMLTAVEVGLSFKNRSAACENIRQ